MLVCLVALLSTRQKSQDIQWREADLLKEYLDAAHALFLIEINRMLRSSTCSVDSLKICFAVLHFFHSTGFAEEYEETILSLFREYCFSFLGALQSIEYNAHLYSVMATTSILFLRKMLPQLANPPKLKNPFILNPNTYLLNTRRLLHESAFFNSTHIGDEEELGVFDFHKGVMIAEQPLFFGKFIHSHLMVCLAFFNEL